jgi:hypothetical protein
MQRSLLVPMGMLSAALALGCSDQPTPSEPANTPRPSFRTEHNPDGPGAFAIHIPEASFVNTDPDPAPGLTAIIGATYAQHLEFCETGEPPFPMDRLLVFRPDGSVKTRVQGAQVPLLVWQTAIPFIDYLAEICDPAFLALPHLEGTGQFLDRDSDLFFSANRADAWGFRIVGQASSEAGDRFHFLGKFRGLALRSGETRYAVDFQLNAIGQ